MSFVETRKTAADGGQKADFTQAIFAPMTSFGGLWAPESFTHLGAADLKAMQDLSYKDLAKKLFSVLDLGIDEDLLQEALNAYDAFDGKDPVHFTKLGADLISCELWHGKTRAFKDMALAPFGKLFSTLAARQNKHYLILTATSGDTGPASLSAFAGAKNVRVVCLYPNGGTSLVQRLQMTTQSAPNLKVLGANGNFDDTQNILKMLLKDEDFNGFLAQNGLALSAANSVNFGRIAFQIVYYFYAYFHLVKAGEISLGGEVDFVVPSGNFGNALGGYYAKRLGLPVRKLIIASNENNVLTDFFTRGEYNAKDRALIKTVAPAMDILKSSNVERLLFAEFGADRTRELMAELDGAGYYRLRQDELARLQATFEAFFVSQDEIKGAIKEHAKRGVLLDPHTAVGACYAPEQKTVLLSTAEWTKFPATVAACVLSSPLANEQEALDKTAKTFGAKIPAGITSLFDKPVVHNSVLDLSSVKQAIKDFIQNS